MSEREMDRFEVLSWLAAGFGLGVVLFVVLVR